MSVLLVIITEGVSSFVAKGEVIDRYYNPGEYFSEVHLLMTNADHIAPEQIQRLVGKAKLTIHNLPAPKFIQSLGWREFALRRWATQAVDLAKVIRPNLMRCHSAGLNAYLARRIKAELNIPYVVSLHINPDEDVRGRTRSVKQWLTHRVLERLEKQNLRQADLVLPVYQPIVPFLRRIGVNHFEVAYNVLNPAHLQKKESYHLHQPVKILSVGRQIREKNPDQLILALKNIPRAELTLVGDGPFHSHLRQVAAEAGLDSRVHFRPAVSNDELCRELPDFDIFATHTEYWEISKSVLEPLLTGLPIILNRRRGEPVPELTDKICLLVENTAASYEQALRQLIENHDFRESLGRRAYQHAQEHWAPAKTESKFVEVYQRFC